MRNRRPRPPIVVRPSYVSDETCFAVLGILPRPFRERIVPRCKRVARIGRRVVVELDEVERVMRSLSTGGDEADNEAAIDDDPSTADEVLRRLGRVRAPSPEKR